jgi:hypothetical protein
MSIVSQYLVLNQILSFKGFEAHKHYYLNKCILFSANMLTCFTIRDVG